MMILYKYVSFETGRKILENSTIGFSQPEYFNDPFDLPSYPDEEPGNPIDGIFSRIRIMGKNYIWAQNTGILSLTRTPTNPLMWAHYGDQHRGMVIGVDAVAAGLTSEQSNLIPAQYGSVIYISRRPNQPFVGKPSTDLAVGATHHFPPDHYEKLQRLFLHKPLCWSYEEEVRVVKCLKGVSQANGQTQSGTFEIMNVGNRPLYLLSLPQVAIKEIYIGFRVQEADDLYYQTKEQYPHLNVYDCKLNDGNLSVDFSEYTTIAESIE